MQIEVIGLASGRSRYLTYEAKELKQDLLSWLRAKGITIASSCDGEGVCRKCGIQNGWLTCELSLEEFLKLEPTGRIEVSYL